MTGLVKVELVRLLCRRAVLVLLVAAVVVPTVVGVARVLNTRPPSADAVAEAERAVQADLESKWFTRDLARCERHPDRYGVRGEDDVTAACTDAMAPTVEGYLWYDKLRLAQERDEGSGVAVVTIVAVLMLLIGATFAGHDWASGSMGNQLLFEPRRLRVWAAKALVLAALAAVAATVVLTAYWLALAWVADRRGALQDGVLLDCLQMGWRGAAVAGGVAVGGYALTMFFRSTVAALGVMLAIGVAGGALLAVVGIGSIWNPGLNLLAVVLDGATYWQDVPCPGGGGGCQVERTLSLERGLVVLGTALVAAVAASAWSFRRRDVG